VHEVVERLDLRWFPEVYIEEGGRLDQPSMMLKVSLYGYGLGMNEFAAVGAADRDSG
jgi:transposase